MARLYRVLSSEKGVSSVVAFVIMLMVSTVGFTLYFMTTSDSKLSTRKLQTAQAFYMAEAGLEYALKRMNSDLALDEDQAIPIENGTVLVDTSILEDGTTLLLAEAQIMEMTRRVGVYILNTVNLGEFAIYCTGDVDNVTALDEEGNEDPDLMISNADSLPPIDYLGLTDMALNQGHLIFDGNFKPPNNWPNGSFYFSAGVPNVTHCINDMTVNGGRDIYGIFVVEGNVKLNGSSRVYGIIYLPNLESEVLQVTVDGGGSPGTSSVQGGIIANGDVIGNGSHITVRYVEEYMNFFGEFEKPSDTYRIVRWMEL